jgi:hypothetical protein
VVNAANHQLNSAAMSSQEEKKSAAMSLQEEKKAILEG